MSAEAFSQFKQQQKAIWPGFAPMAQLTAAAAPRLVHLAGIGRDTKVLDVACGTGVVALTAARLGARVTGVDLTPELLAEAHKNAALMQLQASFVEGDAEALPAPDGSFDVVVSQFGHIFAPRPEVALGEMLRVLKPGGTLAFSTWPPETLVGRSFTLLGQYLPPLPEGVTPPVSWGNQDVVLKRLGTKVRDVVFARDAMEVPALSPAHYRVLMESFGAGARLRAALETAEPAKWARLRGEVEALVQPYFDNNRVRQDFLLTRAVKV